MKYVLYFLFWIVLFYVVIKFGISSIEEMEDKKKDNDTEKQA